jgi:hypothetical protein
VILKSYLDGGNQPDRFEYDRITLALVCGSPNQWKRFEVAWGKILYKHRTPYLHTTDAVTRKGEVFSDWTDDRTDLLITDCVKTIETHIHKNGRGLYPVTFTIPLDDYAFVRRQDARLPGNVADMCVSECLGFCARWGHRQNVKSYQLYFDQGEPFYGHFLDRFNNKQARKDTQWFDMVSHHSKLNMRKVPALQLADLLAWAVNHIDCVSRPWHAEILDMPGWEKPILSYKYLLYPSDKRLAQMQEWNLNKRKPDK